MIRFVFPTSWNENLALKTHLNPMTDDFFLSQNFEIMLILANFNWKSFHFKNSFKAFTIREFWELND